MECLGRHACRSRHALRNKREMICHYELSTSRPPSDESARSHETPTITTTSAPNVSTCGVQECVLGTTAAVQHWRPRAVLHANAHPPRKSVSTPLIGKDKAPLAGDISLSAHAHYTVLCAISLPTPRSVEGRSAFNQEGQHLVQSCTGENLLGRSLLGRAAAWHGSICNEYKGYKKCR